MVREIYHVNSQNKYIIPNRRASEGKREFNMQAEVKTKNGKNLKVKALVDSGCTHTGIDEQLVKKKRIQTKKIDFSFEVFNADGTKNGEVTKIAPLEVEINRHKETLEAAVTDLDGTDMFLGHDWLVKHNPEVNWKNRTIKFTRCPGNCTMTHKDIWFNSRRTKETETKDNQEQDNSEIGKEPDKTNPEDLPEYIRPFTHLFNKKKFEKLPERREWDHEINLMEEAPRELNAKAYTMTIKEEEALNQWLDEQLKVGLIVESKSRYAAPCFYIPKKDSSLRLVQDYRKLNQVTIKDKTPLLLIGEVIDKLKEARYFNKLDLIWGYVRRGSHRGGSPQNGLRDERTCGMTLASAYVLRCLSAAWSQLQMRERSPSGSEY